MLEFVEDGHAYSWDGKRVPSVTQVLAPLTDYSRIPAGKLETARQKGKAVHKMVELYCQDDLDVAALPGWLRPVLAQWIKFVAESGFKTIASERRVYHPTYHYAGCLDLFGKMNAGSAFIDIKRSFLAGGVIGLQLAGYKDAYCAEHPEAKQAKRYALKLTETGPYRLEPYTKETDLMDFLTCLNFKRLQEKHQ